MLEQRLQARFGPGLGVMSIGLDAYGPPLKQAPLELALYVRGMLRALCSVSTTLMGSYQDKERPLGFPDQQRLPQDAPPFYDPQ